MTKNEFVDELTKMGIIPTQLQLDQLDSYYKLLIEWNKKINLTAITDKEQVYLKHFYDSLTIIKIINLNNYNNLCDIGSGAGFPGIVLKIFYPNLEITLVDSLNKRIIFLNEVIKILNLKKIITVHDRAEEYSRRNKEKYDIVTARAVAPLNILLEYSLPMVKQNKYFVAMKGNISEELENSQSALKILNGKIEKTKKFKLPIEESNRTLIKVEKTKLCPGKYPRKNNEIKKNML